MIVIILSIIGYVFHMCILSWVIGSSISKRESFKYEKIKIRLLVRLLRKQGATDQEINEIVGKETKNIMTY